MKWLIEEESGQGMVEYAFILTFIAMALVIAVGTLGTNLASKYGEIAGSLP